MAAGGGGGGGGGELTPFFLLDKLQKEQSCKVKGEIQNWLLLYHECYSIHNPSSFILYIYIYFIHDVPVLV